jgi:hypothetical protein
LFDIFFALRLKKNHYCPNDSMSNELREGRHAPCADYAARSRSTASLRRRQPSSGWPRPWRRESRSLIYAADFAAMTGLVGFLTENCCGGGSCLPDAAAPKRKKAS